MIVNFISYRKITSLLVFAILVFIFWYSAQMQAMFYDALFYIEAYFHNHQILGIFVFIGLAAISALLSPFSSVPLVPVAIIMWGGFLATMFLVSGWLIGHIFSYFIGYYAGHSMAKKLIPFDKINNYSQKLSPKSEFLLILLFRLSMPAEIPGYVLGIVRYNFLKYFIATLIAEFPFAVLTIYGGDAFIKKDVFVFVGIVVVGIAIISVMLYLFRQRMSRNRKNGGQSNGSLQENISQEK